MLDYGFSIGGVGKIVVEKAEKPASQRVPSVKRPAATAPVSINPAGTAAKTAANSGASNTSADSGAAAAKPAVVSDKPVARGSGVRMPVVRRPGA